MCSMLHERCCEGWCGGGGAAGTGCGGPWPPWTAPTASSTTSTTTSLTPMLRTTSSVRHAPTLSVRCDGLASCPAAAPLSDSCISWRTPFHQHTDLALRSGDYGLAHSNKASFAGRPPGVCSAVQSGPASGCLRCCDAARWLVQMPHYHAEEATRAIKPILGDYYTFDPREVYCLLATLHCTACTTLHWKCQLLPDHSGLISHSCTRSSAALAHHPLNRLCSLYGCTC